MRVNQLGSIDADNREIRFRILANQIGAKHAALRRGNLQPACPMDDVAVRENITVGRNHKARPGPAGFGSALTVVSMVHADVYHRWANLSDDTRDGPRVVIEQFAIPLL